MPNQIAIGHIGVDVAFGTVTVWQVGNWAEYWLSDACQEAAVTDEPVHARRREILFSVCFVESYFVEWVREVLRPKGAWSEFGRLLEKKQGEGTLEGFLAVMEQMKTEGYLVQVPLAWSSDLRRLFRYRNWLVHGRASRVYGGNTRAKRARPTPDELRKLKPGWATRTALRSTAELASAAGIEAPEFVRSTLTKLGKEK